MLETLRRLSWLILLFPTLVQLVVAQNSGRSLISEERVANAISSAGISVRSSEIEFLSDVSAATPDPALQVISTTPYGGGTARVELRCRSDRECLPFYLLVHGIKTPGANRSQPSPRLASTSDRTQAALFNPQLVHGGDHVMLILETEDSRISMPVICLQGGFRGQTIRVRSDDGRRQYSGAVVAAGLLKGNL